MKPHRWSGWPGAYCLVCGCEDANEVCIATRGHFDGLVCVEGHIQCSEHELCGCSVHINGPCGGQNTPEVKP